MDAKHYQELSGRTLNGLELTPTTNELRLLNMALGIAGEAGEVADVVKKAVFHGHGVDLAKLGDEMGDLLWYIAAACTILGLDLGEVMEANIEKLRRRYPAGFSVEASLNRAE